MASKPKLSTQFATTRGQLSLSSKQTIEFLEASLNSHGIARDHIKLMMLLLLFSESQKAMMTRDQKLRHSRLKIRIMLSLPTQTMVLVLEEEETSNYLTTAIKIKTVILNLATPTRHLKVSSTTLNLARPSSLVSTNLRFKTTRCSRSSLPESEFIVQKTKS